jgi:hypothetical protein
VNTYGTTLTATLVGERKGDDGWEHYLWTVTLTREDRTRDLPYRMGLGHVGSKCGRPLPSSRYNTMPCSHVRCYDAGPVPTPPDLYTVLTGLKADATHGETFNDWARDYGYDTDSIKARETYFACQQSETDSRAFFGSDWQLILDDEDYT